LSFRRTESSFWDLNPGNPPAQAQVPFRGAIGELADLESDEGKKAITALHVHVDGIIDFVEKRKREPL
jgi:hypothetical protein